MKLEKKVRGPLLHIVPIASWLDHRDVARRAAKSLSRYTSTEYILIICLHLMFVSMVYESKQKRTVSGETAQTAALRRGY